MLSATGLGRELYFRRHVFPQMPPRLTQAIILIPQFMMAEVMFSFVGLDIRMKRPASRGSMLADLERYRMLTWDRGMAPMLARALVLFTSFHAVNTLRAQVQSVATN